MKFPIAWLHTTTQLNDDEQYPQPKLGLVWATIVFLVVACALARDEFLNGDSLPLKSTSVATVPLFNAWTIGWNADRLLNGLDGYWDAPIFHPTKNAFAFSEPQPATMLIAPVVWITGSAVAGYKAWLLLSLTLNGYFTALLLKRFRYGLFHQLVGGIAIMLLPIVHQRIDVLQLVPLWGILWFWSSLFVLIKQPGLRTALESGVAFAMCFGLCVHHALFLTLLMPFAGLVFVPALLKRKVLFSAAAAIVVASLLVLPIVMPIKAAADTHDFVREEDLVKRLSALPQHYLVSQKNSLTCIDYFEGPDWRQFCVGWARMGLAVVGIILGLVVGHRRRWILFLTLTGVFAFAFSLGLNLDVFGWKPWQFLCQHVPGFGQVRSVYRFVWFVQMVLVLLAIEGLTGLHAACGKWFANHFTRTALTCLVILPGAFVAVEVLPEPTTRGGVPDIPANRQWIEFVKDNALPGKSIACLPFATGTGVEDYDITTRWMLLGLEHRVPMVNGYSGFFPEGYIALRDWMNANFPADRTLTDFAAYDVDLLVVSRNYCDPKVMLKLKTDALRLELMLEDPVGIDVYRLIPVE